MELGANQRGISRREILRIGGVVIPASVLLPTWMTATAQTATTFDFYISTSGNDKNAGTLAAPWAITSLVNTSPNHSAMAGKRIGLIAGTYNIPGTMANGRNPTDNDWPVLSIPPGTQSSPTYLGSSDTSGNYSPRAATIALVPGGQGGLGGNKWYNPPIGADYLPSGDFWITIDGIVVNGNGSDSVAAGNEGSHLIAFRSGTTDSYTRAGTAQGVVVQNCEVFGISATDGGGNDAAVWFQGTNGAILRNCYIHDVNKSNQIDHAHGHEEYGCQFSQILYNTFSNCTGGGAESKTGCFNNTAAYNYFYNCGNGGGGNTAVIQGWDGGEQGDGAASTFQLHHNIFDGCGRVCFGEYFNALHENGVNWYNNTIYNSGAVVLQATGPWIQHYNNLYVVISGSASGVASFTNGDTNPLAFDCVYSASGNYGSVFSGQSEANVITGKDPLLSAGTTSVVTGKGATQFQLASGSPCIGAGRVGGVASGTACNIGAWDGTVTQIGASFTSGAGSSPPPAVPNPPVLTVS